MKQPVVRSVDECVAELDRFDAIIDARSPSEFAEDRLPGARNCPVLDDSQRAHVGTLYKQVGAFEAKRVGAALVSRNIAGILEHDLADMPRGWRPVVYCWRGGNRSGSLAVVLASIGWHTTLIDGGYREFRRRVIADLARLPAPLHFMVLAGRTGAGKSLLLQRIRALGGQVLDLEALAEHRGSVLGLPPGVVQPSQKAFETRVWDALRRYDADRPVFVESESKKVGQCQVPDALIAAMRAADCVVVDADDGLRVDLLMREYDHFVTDPQRLRERLECLAPLHGNDKVAGWVADAQGGRWPELVGALLRTHYDPAYDRSMRRNFSRLDQARRVSLAAIDPEGIDRAAREILALAT